MRAVKKTAILKSDGRAGSALILVLWIIGMLSLIVISFAFDAHLEGKVVSYSRKKVKVEAFATSGIELAKSYLDRSYQITGNETDEEKEKDPRYDDVNDLRCGKTVTVGYVFRKETENEDAEGDEIGEVTVTISPENSLRNINKLTEEVQKHNKNTRRMPVVEEQIKVINHRIEDLEGFHKPTN